MSNIYEALEQACRKNSCSRISKQLVLQTEAPSALSLTSEMTWLHNQLDFLLTDAPCKLIQFLGCRGGEGVSTIVRQFAKVAVERHGKSALILDSAYEDPTPKVNVNLTCEYGWLDLLEKGELEDKVFFRFGNSDLFFAPISVQASLVPPIKDLSATMTLWKKLKERFDLILIDSSSDTDASESIALCRNVDGVVLVVEAGKTRRKVAENMKRKIEASGGHLLGVVLNKRRYYIPESLYKKLA